MLLLAARFIDHATFLGNGTWEVLHLIVCGSVPRSIEEVSTGVLGLNQFLMMPRFLSTDTKMFLKILHHCLDGMRAWNYAYLAKVVAALINMN